MDAIRTPLVGIALAFVVLFAEGFAGSALMTRAEARWELHQRQEVDELIAEITARDSEIKRCPRVVPVVDLSAWATRASQSDGLEDL